MKTIKQHQLITLLTSWIYAYSFGQGVPPGNPPGDPSGTTTNYTTNITSTAKFDYCYAWQWDEAYGGHWQTNRFTYLDESYEGGFAYWAPSHAWSNGYDAVFTTNLVTEENWVQVAQLDTENDLKWVTLQIFPLSTNIYTNIVIGETSP